MAFNQDGSALASTSADGTIRLWRDGSSAGVLDVGAASPLAFTKDGAGLVYRAGEELRLWDLTTEIATVLDHPTYVYTTSYSPDGTRLASGCFVGPAFVWDPIDGRRVASYEYHAGALGFTTVLNGRFKGGWTTRHYGVPTSGVHAIQMELAQRAYMKEAPPWSPRARS